MRFKDNHMVPIYPRLRDEGRMLPRGSRTSTQLDRAELQPMLCNPSAKHVWREAGGRGTGPRGDPPRWQPALLSIVGAGPSRTPALCSTPWSGRGSRFAHLRRRTALTRSVFTSRSLHCARVAPGPGSRPPARSHARRTSRALRRRAVRARRPTATGTQHVSAFRPPKASSHPAARLSARPPPPR